MDEIEYKLNTNSSVLIVNAVDKLITTIKSKFKPVERQKFVLENEELKFLREKCSSKDNLVSLTACQGLLALVELGVLEIGHTMSTVVTLLPSAHNYSAIVSTISGLLTLDLKSRLIPGQPYVCQFNLTSPRHPLVTVLQMCPAAEQDVIAQMHALCNHPDYIISSNALELLRPVFIYLTCAPSQCRDAAVWQLLITKQAHTLLIDCLTRQQTHTPSLAARAVTAYSAVVEAALNSRQTDQVTALLPLLARGTTQIVTGHCRDPRPCYTLISRCTSETVTSLYAGPLVVTLLGDNVTHSSLTQLAELLHVGLTLITKFEQSSISLNVFAALCLQWLHLPSYLTTNSLKFASKIVDIYLNESKEDTKLNTPNLKSNKMFETLLYTDSYIFLVFKLLQTWESIRDNPEKLKSWFDNLETADSKLQLELVPFLIGIMMEKTKGEWFEEFSLRSLELLIRLVDVKREIAVQLVPILLFKLANDKSPRVKMECLKALPLMALTKENVPVIVSILNKLKTNKSVPASFLILLYTRLAETQVRCFPYLQELLVDPNIGRPDDLKWETEIARATAVKRICQIRASTHGLELVSVVSAILNKCTDKQSAIAASIALEALKELWQASAVAPVGAWKALEPKLGRDSRPIVQISICNLLSVIPSLRTSTPEFVSVLSSTAHRLWCYIADSNQPEVVNAACSALAGYKVDDYTLKDVPEIYRKTVKLPASYCKTPADAARKPEDVLDYIPCEIWPELYRYTNEWALPGVQQLVRRLIEREVKSYRSGVYEPREPATAGYLPAHSVVRGVMGGFKKQATNPSYEFPDPSLLSLLTTLTYEYPKPLPPLDLNFLHEVYHKGDAWKAGCVKLAARQAQTSGSARRFVDNYLQGALQNCQEFDVDLVFNLLPILCRSMPPNSLRPVLDKYLKESYNIVAIVKTKEPLDFDKIVQDLKKERDSKTDKKEFEKDQRDLTTDQRENENDKRDLKMEELRSKYKFIKQMDMIRESIESDKIHDANRILLSQIVESYFNIVKDDNVSWASYVKTCSSLPTDTLERMTSPSSWWEVTSQGLRNACAVRCLRASYAGLVWVNEIVDACITQITEQEFSMSCLYAALKVVDPDAAATKEWFTQLMARTQVAFKQTDSDSSKQYLFDVFAVSALVISQWWCLQPDVTSRATYNVLPAAVATLLKREAYSSCGKQVCEWLAHTDSLCPDPVSATCRRALVAARGDHTNTRLDRHFGKDTNLDE